MNKIKYVKQITWGLFGKDIIKCTENLEQIEVDNDDDDKSKTPIFFMLLPKESNN